VDWFHIIDSRSGDKAEKMLPIGNIAHVPGTEGHRGFSGRVPLKNPEEAPTQRTRPLAERDFDRLPGSGPCLGTRPTVPANSESRPRKERDGVRAAGRKP
jgi:hypothetical protein